MDLFELKKHVDAAVKEHGGHMSVCLDSEDEYTYYHIELSTGMGIFCLTGFSEPQP